MASQKKPSLTADLRVGDLTQALFKLGKLGIVPEQFAIIGKEGSWELAIMVADIIRTYLMFTDPSKQIDLMLEINDMIWEDPDISEKSINPMKENVPPVPYSSPVLNDRPNTGLYCATLIYETGDPIKTFLRNWAAMHYILKKIFGENLIGESTPGSVGLGDISWGTLDMKEVQLSDGTRLRPKGYYWVVAELGRRQEPIGGATRIGTELPMIIAMHPDWFIECACEGSDFPHVAASGIEILDRAKCQKLTPYLALFEHESGKGTEDEKILRLLETRTFSGDSVRSMGVKYGTIINEVPSID